MITLGAIASDRLYARLRERRDKLAVVAITQTSASGRVPEIESLRLGNITRAVEIRNEPLHKPCDVHPAYARFKHRRCVSNGFVIRQTIEAFVIIGAPAATVVPAKRFIDVVSGECSGGPVVTVRTRFGIHEETIKESKAKRERAMVWRDVLSLSVRPSCCRARSKDRE